jgi:hypothetical protein
VPLKATDSSEVPKSKPQDARSALLENIRAGIKLKSKDERQLAAAPLRPTVTSLSVAEILRRRVAIAGHSDSDEDDLGGDDEEWSD